MAEAWKNKLYFGDNLEILRTKIDTESIDLVYLDPPFNSKSDYNVLFKNSSGDASTSQATAFKDTWEWDEAAAMAYHEIMMRPDIPPQLRKLMEALKLFLTGDAGKKGNSMMAYLTMMALRLVELYRVLKPSGSIILHCDPTASHYIKLVLDAIFGFSSFKNEVVWQRTNAHNDAKLTKFGASHDILFLFAKDTRLAKWNAQRSQLAEAESDLKTHDLYRHTDGKLYRKGDCRAPGNRGPRFEWHGHTHNWRFTEAEAARLESEGRIIFSKTGMPRVLRPVDLAKGSPLQDVWTDLGTINSGSQERLGYPTQKPEALLERILKACSDEGDLVLDPFCGCGTTVAVAEKLKRRWIGIDVAPVAVDLMERRLLDMFSGQKGPASLANIPVQKRRHAMKAYWEKGQDELGINIRTGLTPFEVLGVPTDLESARFLFNADAFRFEWWCVTMVAAQGKQSRSADGGIDGVIPFVDKTGEYKKCLVSVKGGANRSRENIATLKGDMAKEGAISGILITLEEPTAPMRREAALAGRWNSDLHPERSFPRIQILTVAEILEGQVPDIPRWGLDTFKSPQRVAADAKQQIMEL